MKMVNLTYTFAVVIITVLSGPAQAEPSVKTAMANCWEEAVSTGLENATDIAEYVDLCMQAWQSPTEYTEWNPASEETNEPLGDTGESVDQ